MSIEKAISAAGGPTALGLAVGVSVQVVINWRNRGRVPAEYCRAVESATRGVVTRYDLRPDVFGEEPEKVA